MADDRDDAKLERSDTLSGGATPQAVEHKDATDVGASKYLNPDPSPGPEQAAHEPNNGPARAPVGADYIEDKPEKDLYERLADKDVTPR